MKKYFYAGFIATTLLASHQLWSQQSISINTDGSAPHSSAMLDVKSTTKGMLVPRMTSAQRTAIVSPAQGLQVFDISTGTFWFYNSGWIQMITGGSSTSYWNLGSGGSIYNNDAWKILIGTTDIGPGYVNIKVPISMSGLFLSETGTTSADFMSIGVYTGGGTTSTRFGSILGNFGNGFQFANQSNGPIMFQTSTSERMRITAAGLVGINTLAPNSQLEVQTATGAPGITHTNGTIRLTTMMNSATSASFGTTTNHPLFFFTNNTFPPAMTISTTGNVGVGGSIANDKLEVFTADNSYGLTHSGSNGVSVGSYVGGGAGWYGTKSNHPLYLYAASGNSFIALLQNGSVGIGTAATAGKLHVYANSASNYPGIMVEEADNDYARISFRTANALNSGNNFWSIAGYNHNTRGSERLNFYNGAIGDVMTMTGTGNVGIGTFNPTYKLSVNGTIQSKEVRVQTGWADFVFENDYRLLPLPEVERFILANKHLPGIPSAKEIERDGLLLGDIQTKMMQKIEELTLYTIEANKIIGELKKRIETLEKANK